MSHATKKICAECANVFVRNPRNTWKYWECAKYCSSQCAGKANSRRKIEKRPAFTIVFEKGIERGSDCWLWTMARDKDGYGAFNYAGKSYRAASVALLLDGRPVLPGMYACHHCDNPPCVNPAHLYVGTPKENAQDARRRGRLRAGRKAKVTQDDVIAIRAAAGTHKSIAARFGITGSNVSMIRSRKTWKHVR